MAEETRTSRVAVVGGGISGLSAAYRVLELSRQNNMPVELTLLESSDRVGGVIQTIQQDGFLIEAGPDSFVSNKPAGLGLCERLGLAGQLLTTRQTHRRGLVARRDRLFPIPNGYRLLAPSRMGPIWRSPIFSLRGKLRMAAESWMKPRKASLGDESLRSFVTRRFGREALDRLAQPLVCGIYTADPDKLSLRATLPQFLEMESRHGSVLKALGKKTDDKHKDDASPGEGDAGARYSLFVTFKGGMSVLPQTLLEKIGPERVRFRAPVARVERAADGSGAWDVILLNNDVLHADALILACPTHRTVGLIQPIDPKLAIQLAEISYASSAVLHFAFRREQIEHPLDAFGFVVPFAEQRYLMACSFSSVKFEGRAPDEWVLLRAFLGGALQEELLQRSDDGLIAAARWDLEMLLGLMGPQRFVTVHRWVKAMPQYHVGHLERVEAIRQAVAEHPRLRLASNALAGVGIPDCIAEGERAAEQIMAALWRRK